MQVDTWQMVTLLCCVCYDEKQTHTLFIWLLQRYNTCSDFLLYHLKLLQCTNTHNRTDRIVDKEDSLTDVVIFTVTCN